MGNTNTKLRRNIYTTIFPKFQNWHTYLSWKFTIWQPWW
jgi:hypothetical protein